MHGITFAAVSKTPGERQAAYHSKGPQFHFPAWGAQVSLDLSFRNLFNTCRSQLKYLSGTSTNLTRAEEGLARHEWVRESTRAMQKLD